MVSNVRHLQQQQKFDFWDEFNLQFSESQNPQKGHFCFLCQTVIPVFPPRRPSCCLQFVQKQLPSPVQPKICMKWLHTLTWLNDVRSGVTPDRSHPSICSASPCCANSITHGFPFPELCFENRSFILTVNSRADRYSLTTLPLRHKPSLWLSARVHISLRPARRRGGASQVIAGTHTHEEFRIAHVGRIRRCGGEQMFILLFLVVGEVFWCHAGVRNVLGQKLAAELLALLAHTSNAFKVTNFYLQLDHIE